MVKQAELFSFFESVAPQCLAEEYDNVGLLVEGKADDISCVMVTLDADEQTVLEAKEAGAELIVSHHPVMFRPINRLTEEEGGQRTLRRLLQNGIGLFSLHTNFDAAENGLCDAFLDAFGNFESRSSFDGASSGIGRIGTLQKPCRLRDLLERGRKAYSPEVPLRYVGDAETMVNTVAVCNGGGGDLLFDAAKLNADVYISGDFKHHHARFAYENHINLIEINHFDAEIAFCWLMQKKLESVFGESLKVLVSKSGQNLWKSF